MSSDSGWSLSSHPILVGQSKPQQVPDEPEEHQLAPWIIQAMAVQSQQCGGSVLSCSNSASVSVSSWAASWIQDTADSGQAASVSPQRHPDVEFSVQLPITSRNRKSTIGAMHVFHSSTRWRGGSIVEDNGDV